MDGNQADAIFLYTEEEIFEPQRINFLLDMKSGDFIVHDSDDESKHLLPTQVDLHLAPATLHHFYKQYIY